MDPSGRGDLLARASMAGGSADPVTIYTANIPTEITVIILAATAGDGTLRLFHDNAGSTYDVSTALLWDYPFTAANQGNIWTSFFPGGGIHIRPRGLGSAQPGTLGAAANVVCTISVYGILTGVSPVPR